jgi:hypothetical protein
MALPRWAGRHVEIAMAIADVDEQLLALRPDANGYKVLGLSMQTYF